jgi:ribosome-binding protein aMBF1 (putative translation factor)
VSRLNDTARLASMSSPLTGETRPRMAKANLRKPEPDAWRARVGSAVERTRTLSGLSLKEFADAIGRDERQVARWITAVERPQVDAIFAVESLRGVLVISLAELAHDIEVITEIRIRRRTVA